MKMICSYALFLVLVAMAVPCFGQANACSPVGTWYGDSDMTTPYQLTITPIGGDRYALRFQQVIDFRSVGITGVTDYTGEMRKKTGGRYEGRFLAFFWIDGAGDLNPEMDSAESTMELDEGCQVLTHTITKLISYIPWNEEKVPFVTAPDMDWLAFLGLDSLVEKYHRMPERR